MLKTTTLGTRATLCAIGAGGLIAAATLAPSAHADTLDPRIPKPLQYDAMVRDHERQPFTVMDAVQVLTLVGTSSLLGALIYDHLV